VILGNGSLPLEILERLVQDYIEAEQASMPPSLPSDAALGDIWIRPADGKAMVYVPGGTFEMGAETESNYDNEGPVHTVTVDDFWLDRTEVTNAQFRQCVEAGGCSPPMKRGSISREIYYGDPAYDDYPVLHVMWYQAVVYCEWAGARLPTEAEWEYAACGADDRLYPWGDELSATRLNCCDVHCDLPHADKTEDDGWADTAPVGSFPAGVTWNGALDMAGNAWEWVADWFAYLYPAEPQENPTGPTTGVYRVIRGGGWDTNTSHNRCAYRNWLEPQTDYDSLSFRCVVPVSGPLG
jgi:formylglycine-generating enzyme required for sulfatase activity